MLSALLLAPLLVFHGNVALLEDVYRSVLDLPPSTRPTDATAREVATHLSRFLHRAGYGLAVVRARVQGEQILVDIDEGRLDKVIFVGGGAFETLRLRYDLRLREDVFNEPELQRQLDALAARMGLGEFAYEVVPVVGVDAARPPPVTEPLQRFGLFRPGRAYELHILVRPGSFRPGISPEVEIDSVEGGGIGATYHSGELLHKNDRFELGGRVAGALRQRLDGSGSYFTFTRFVADGEYDAPPIARFIRPSIRGRADLSDRQRSDLHLESFWFANFEGVVQLLFLPVRQVRAALGTGLGRRLLYDVEPQTGVPLTPGPRYTLADTRPFAEASLMLTFDPDTLRRDRHHVLELGARYYARPHATDDSALHLAASYQKMWPLGWDELWIEARGYWKEGFVTFPEEVSIGGGDLLRGPFNEVYTRRVAALDLEYRLSLWRDAFKIGVFHNGAVYSLLDRTSSNESFAAADAVGLGIHALIIDEFQLDAYFGAGWATPGHRFETGAALAIRQAF
jgi:hypothetical protein